MLKVAAIVLAAGAGRRFGGPKALAPFDSGLLIDHVTRLAHAGGCAPVIAVVGAEAARVRELAELTDVHVVEATDWASGMSASLRRGLRAASVLSCTAAEVGAVAAVATYDGDQGHPVMLARSVWDEVVESASGDRGAREWLVANSDRVERIACDGLGTAADADTVARLEELEAVIRRQER